MSEIHGAVGSYVVNALDGAELKEFEAHLAVCDTCRREVVEFSETVAQLGSLVESPPPPALRTSVLSAIREVRPLPPEEQVAPRDEGGKTDTLPMVRAEHSATPAAAVDELAVRRQRRGTRLLALAVAATMVVALALGGWVANLRQDRQAQIAQANLETQLFTAPDAKYYTRTMKNGVPVTFVVSRSLDKALLLGNLPSPGADKAYQLWTLTTNGKTTVPAPDNVFDGGRARKAWFGNDVKAADGVAVTVEPRGGSKTPTTDLLVSVPL